MQFFASHLAKNVEICYDRKNTFREVPMKDDIISILEEKGPSFSKGQRL